MSPTELAEKLHARDGVLLGGRLLLSLIFVHEGLQLATHFGGAQKAMAALGVGTPLLLATIALQLGAGLSVALGILARLGAVALGLFCLVTASLFHTNFASQNELLHFEKDLAIAGGMFILALAGSGRFSLDSGLAGLRKGRAGEGAKALLALDRGERPEVVAAGRASGVNCHGAVISAADNLRPIRSEAAGDRNDEGQI